VHRDVKPGNILVVRRADGSESVKLTDFGIAKAADAAPVTRNGMVMGTAHYIAPEQATGSDASPSSDVYSLAVCGYECLAGHRPFLSENAVTVAMMHIRDAPPPLPPDVPPTVRALIESTLIKDPRQRYANGGEFADAVALVRAGHPPPTPVGVTHTPPSGLALGVPAGPAGPVGPGSHPTMMPAGAPNTPPATAMYPQHPPPSSNRSVWLWVALAVIGVTLVVMAAVLLPMMLIEDEDGDPGPGGGGSTPSTHPVPGQQGDTGQHEQPPAMPPGQQQRPPPEQDQQPPEQQPPEQQTSGEQEPDGNDQPPPEEPQSQPSKEGRPATNPKDPDSAGLGANLGNDRTRQPDEGW
ncbi:MAG: serine/threonine protein kinase, partial [Thermocrispum sp.]